MSTFSIKLPDSLTKKIEVASEKRGVSKSLIVREALVEYLHNSQNSPKQGSFLELASDLCGSVKGPKDLSTNKKHLEGFGE